MKLLKCKLCGEECDLIGNEHQIERKIKCYQCNYNAASNDTNTGDKNNSEVIIMRRRPLSVD
jgi:hypothetical protein